MSDLVEKLVTKRAKRRARKIEQKKKKTPGDGFQPRRELEGWVRFLQQDVWWLVSQVEVLQQCWMVQSSERTSSDNDTTSQGDDVQWGAEEMEAGEGTVEGDDKFLEQVPAYKPGWEIVFHFGDEELLAEETACDGYGEIMQLEECGYAAISADGGKEWMSPLDEEGPSDEDLGHEYFMRRFRVGRHLGDLQAVTPLGVSIFRHECVSGEMLGDYLMAGDVVVRRFRGRDQDQECEGVLGRYDMARCLDCWRWQTELYTMFTEALRLEGWGSEAYQVCKPCIRRRKGTGKGSLARRGEVLAGRLQMFRGMMAARQKTEGAMGQDSGGRWSDCFGGDKDEIGEMWLHDGVRLF